MALIIPYQSQAGIQTANAGPAAQYRGAEDFYAASGGGSLSRGLQQLAGGTEKLGDVLFEETIRKRREVMELTLIKDVQNFQAEAQAWEDEYRKKNQGHNAIKAEEDAKDFYDKKINALEERWAGNGAALIHIRKNAGSMAVSGVNGMRDYGNEQMDAHRLAETNTQLATAQATFTSPNSTEEDRERDFNTWSRMHTYNLTKAGMPPERAQQEIEAVRKSLETARFETRFKARLDSGDIEGARAELEDMKRRSAAGQTAGQADAAGADEGAEAGGSAAGADGSTAGGSAAGAAGTGEGAGGSAAGTGEGAGMGAGGSAAAGAGAAGNESGLTENAPDAAKAGANAGKDKIGPNQSESASKSAPESGPESGPAGSAAAKSETGANAGEGKPKPPAKPPLLSPESVRAYENTLEKAQREALKKGSIARYGSLPPAKAAAAALADPDLAKDSRMQREVVKYFDWQQDQMTKRIKQAQAERLEQSYDAVANAVQRWDIQDADQIIQAAPPGDMARLQSYVNRIMNGDHLASNPEDFDRMIERIAAGEPLQIRSEYGHVLSLEDLRAGADMLADKDMARRRVQEKAAFVEEARRYTPGIRADEASALFRRFEASIPESGFRDSNQRQAALDGFWRKMVADKPWSRRGLRLDAARGRS